MSIKTITTSFALTAGALLTSGCDHGAAQTASSLSAGVKVPSYALTPKQQENRSYHVTRDSDRTEIYDFYLDTISVWQGVEPREPQVFHLQECSIEEQIMYSGLKAQHFGGTSYIPVNINGGKFEFDSPQQSASDSHQINQPTAQPTPRPAHQHP